MNQSGIQGFPPEITGENKPVFLGSGVAGSYQGASGVYVVPLWATRLRIRASGAGAGGQSGDNGSGGGHGGPSGHVVVRVVQVTPGLSIPWTTGQGSAGGVSISLYGGQAGHTSFGGSSNDPFYVFAHGANFLQGAAFGSSSGLPQSGGVGGIGAPNTYDNTTQAAGASGSGTGSYGVMGGGGGGGGVSGAGGYGGGGWIEVEALP